MDMTRKHGIWFDHCSDGYAVIPPNWPRGYKKFMLNSVEHENLNVISLNIKKFSFFSDKPCMLFFLIMNVKMPTIVGILTFMSGKNFMLS